MRLSSLRQGDHVCALYRPPDEQLRTVAEYIRLGLKRGERCVYIVDDRRATDVLDALAKQRVDVSSAQSDRRLVLLTKRETYLKNGVFDPDQMIWALSAMTDQALTEHCSGLRVTGEMTWALGPETGCDRLLEYEAKLNQFFPGSRAHALCQYNQSRFSPAIIEEVLRRHPIAVIGKQAFSNPFYDAVHLTEVSTGDPQRVAWMLEQITGGTAG